MWNAWQMLDERALVISINSMYFLHMSLSFCLFKKSLPWPENPPNIYARHTGTLDSCFDFIRSHQQIIDDVDRLYVSRKEGGRGLANIEDSVDASMQWLESYIIKRGGRLITMTRNNSDSTNINWIKIIWKQKWDGK